jgi:hypothetical protein
LLFFCALAFSSALYAQEEVAFHNFKWGTSLEEFTKKMGKPVSVEDVNGLKSIVYDKIEIEGYPVFMVVYFSKKGLEGGTYYFHTFSLDELMKCYLDIQKDLLNRFGPTTLCDGIIKERRPYETSWRLESGYVYLKVNTRENEPVTLWYSSPALTKQMLGS